MWGLGQSPEKLKYFSLNIAQMEIFWSNVVFFFESDSLKKVCSIHGKQVILKLRGKKIRETEKSQQT